MDRRIAKIIILKQQTTKCIMYYEIKLIGVFLFVSLSLFSAQEGVIIGSSREFASANSSPVSTSSETEDSDIDTKGARRKLLIEKMGPKIAALIDALEVENDCVKRHNLCTELSIALLASKSQNTTTTVTTRAELEKILSASGKMTALEFVRGL